TTSGVSGVAASASASAFLRGRRRGSVARATPPPSRLRPAIVGRSYPIMPPRPALAVSLYVEGKRCLVLGQGPVAEDRAARLAAAGALVERRGSLDEAGLAGAYLVFVCDAAGAAEVSRAARAAGALVYVVDR